MKRIIFPVLFFVSCLMAVGEISKDAMKRLEETEIAGVSVDTDKNEAREKLEVLEVNTFQFEDDEGEGEGFRMRVVVELKDKAKNLYLVDFTGDRPGDLDVEYLGEDYWKLIMPHGELKQVKVTAYAVQYGFMDEDEFILLAEEYDDVKTLEELTDRTTNSLPGKIRFKHYYMYDDIDLGETESLSRTLREVKRKKSDPDETSEDDSADPDE